MLLLEISFKRRKMHPNKSLNNGFRFRQKPKSGKSGFFGPIFAVFPNEKRAAKRSPFPKFYIGFSES